MAEDELLKNFRGSAHVENGRPEMQSRIAVSADRNGFEPEQVQEITGRTLSPAARSFED